MTGNPETISFFASFLALLRAYFSCIPGLHIGFSGLDLDRRSGRSISAFSAMSPNVGLSGHAALARTHPMRTSPRAPIPAKVATR